jgi:hypothetical protein
MTTKPQTEGSWSKIGRKQYRHVSGKVVTYDCNRWVWVIEGTRYGFKTLTAAQSEVDRLTEVGA